MSDVTLDLEPVSKALGGEVGGIDIKQALLLPNGSPLWTAIHAAFAAHKVLFFREQNLSPDALVAFASRFGPIGHYPFAKPLAEHPDVVAVIKEPHQTTNFGGMWHADSPYLANPSAATVLYALQVPESGGDTLWADMVRALEELPADLRAKIESRKAFHSAANNKTVLRAAPLSEGVMEGRDEAAMDLLEAAHPIVRTHPVSGAKSLYVSPAHTTRILGMEETESAAILETLFSHVVEERFQCRFHWTPGTLAIWDNRCTLHYPLNDYHGKRRAMHRVSIDGEKPS